MWPDFPEDHEKSPQSFDERAFKDYRIQHRSYGINVIFFSKTPTGLFLPCAVMRST